MVLIQIQIQQCNAIAQLIYFQTFLSLFSLRPDSIILDVVLQRYFSRVLKDLIIRDYCE